MLNARMLPDCFQVIFGCMDVCKVFSSEYADGMCSVVPIRGDRRGEDYDTWHSGQYDLQRMFIATLAHRRLEV